MLIGCIQILICQKKWNHSMQYAQGLQNSNKRNVLCICHQCLKNLEIQQCFCSNKSADFCHSRNRLQLFVRSHQLRLRFHQPENILVQKHWETCKFIKQYLNMEKERRQKAKACNQNSCLWPAIKALIPLDNWSNNMHCKVWIEKHVFEQSRNDH